MKHLIYTLFFLFPVFAGAQESQPPTFVLPGATVTAADSAYLIGLPRLRYYETAVNLIVEGSDPTEIFQAYEKALADSEGKFEQLYTLHQKTTAELNAGLERQNTVGRATVNELRTIAAQNEQLLKVASETQGKVKRLARRQFWNKVGIAAVGVVIGGTAAFVAFR